MALDLTIVIRAINEASAAIDQITADLARLQSSNEGGRTPGSGLMEMGDRLTQIGQGFDQSFSQPARQAFAASISAAGDFESSMNRVRALTGESGEAFDALRSQALELGGSTQYSASQSAEAMGFLSMAGFDANEIMAAMPGTLQLAAAGQIDLARAADISSNVLSGYSSVMEESGDMSTALARVNDVMASAMTGANVDLDMLGNSMKYVAPIANGLGLEFEETTAAVAFLGNAGIQGGQAGTTLRQAMASLQNPVGRGAEAIQRLGLETHDSSGNLKSMTDIIGELERTGASAGDVMEVFGTEAGPGMIALLDVGSEGLQDFTQRLRDSGGTAEQIAGVQMEGFNGAVIGMKSALEGLMIAVGSSGFLGILTGLVGGLTSFVSFLSQLPGPILAFGAVLLGIVGIIGPVIIAVGALIGAVGGIAAAFSAGGAIAAIGVVLSGAFAAISAAALPIIGIIALIAAGAALIIANWASVKAFFAGFAEGFLSGMGPAIENFQIILATVGEALAPIVTWISSLFAGSNQAATGIGNLGMAFGLMAAAAINALIMLPISIGALFTAIGATISAFVTSVRMFFVNMGLSIQMAFAGAMSAASATMAGIGAAVMGTIAGVVGAVTGAIATILGGITGGAAQAVAAVVSMGSAMLAAIQGIAAQMFAAGAQIVSSIAQGIMSGIGQVTSAISSVAGAVRGALPFSPPEYGPLSDIMSVGGNIIHSITAGMSPGPITGAMQSALAPAAAMMNAPMGSPQLAGSPAGAGAGGGGGGATTINFSPTINMNGGGESGEGNILNALRQYEGELYDLMQRGKQRSDRINYRRGR